MTVTLTIHRSAHEIGGNCIEISAQGNHRLILDIGRPLEASKGAKGLLPSTLDVSRPIDGILISHPHQDHYGLLGDAPAAWPVYSGAATEKLIKLTSQIVGYPLARPFHSWTSGKAFTTGVFKVTPYLTDHSAFDAYMLLVEVEDRRILYSGDFRVHGRKAKLVSRFMSSPPANVDVLLMEGTNLGTDKPWVSESELEEEFAKLFKTTRGRVFVSWSAQNIDRTVTLFRAARKTGRTLVVDLYTAEVLDLLAQHANLPQPHWDNVKVVVTRAFARSYRRKNNGAFVDRMANHGISAARLAAMPSEWVIMTRRSLAEDYETAGLVPGPDDAWAWSMWRGYLEGEDGERLRVWFEPHGVRPRHIHTSGHASPHDLCAFARCVNARKLVPVHGLGWDGELDGFPELTRLQDGETLVLS